MALKRLYNVRTAFRKRKRLHQAFEADLLEVGFKLTRAGKAAEAGNYIEMVMMVHFHIKCIHLVQVYLVVGVAPLTHQYALRPNNVGLFVFVQ
jgi:hypothetical protein